MSYTPIGHQLPPSEDERAGNLEQMLVFPFRVGDLVEVGVKHPGGAVGRVGFGDRIGKLERIDFQNGVVYVVIRENQPPWRVALSIIFPVASDV